MAERLNGDLFGSNTDTLALRVKNTFVVVDEGLWWRGSRRTHTAPARWRIHVDGEESTSDSESSLNPERTCCLADRVRPPPALNTINSPMNGSCLSPPETLSTAASNIDRAVSFEVVSMPSMPSITSDGRPSTVAGGCGSLQHLSERMDSMHAQDTTCAAQSTSLASDIHVSIFHSEDNMFRISASAVESGNAHSQHSIQRTVGLLGATLDKAFTGCVLELSRDNHGCRAVQRALEEACNEEQRCRIAYELQGHVREAAMNLNANFVVQKCIICMHPRSLDFILDELTINPDGISSIARHKYGCRVIQRLLEYFTPAQVEFVADDLLKDCIVNCCDPYGKYAVQCLCEHGKPSQIMRLMQFLVDNVTALFTDRHACSVIARAMATLPREQNVLLAQAAASCPEFSRSKAQSKEQQYVTRLVLQALPGRNLGARMQVRQAIPKSSTRNKRKGKGGGAVAQLNTELVDLVESLHVACQRRNPGRIRKALARIEAAMYSPLCAQDQIMMQDFRVQAAHACEEARFSLQSLEKTCSGDNLEANISIET